MQAQDILEFMFSSLVIKNLGISKMSILKGLLPYLDTNDKILLKQIYDGWLGGINTIEWGDENE